MSVDDIHLEEFKANRRNFDPVEMQQDNRSNEEQEINSPFELHELRSAVNKCKRKSLPGQDNISYKIIKEISRSGLLKFLEIINLIWSRGTLPLNVNLT